MNPNSPQLRSFIAVSANSHFSIQNLPYGVFCPKGQQSLRVGVAIGEYILDLAVIAKNKLLSVNSAIFSQDTLNEFMRQHISVWQDVRQQVSQLLRCDNPQLRDNESLRAQALHRMSDCFLSMPIAVGDYTDFYSSQEHARNVGSMFRDKDNPLLPNWKHIPVGYHGRASSVVVSGTDIVRPHGQVMLPTADSPIFTSSKRLDFEIEFAAVIGGNSKLGTPISINNAQEYIFGYVLMNDWSARDLQKWEYVPLGPFVSKSFATSISPWVVTQSALEPFCLMRVQQDPKPLSYLCSASARQTFFDVNLTAKLATDGDNAHYTTITQTNTQNLYWSFAQQIAHHTVTGCNLRTGDLLASGTISGDKPATYGSLLELSWNGSQPIAISDNCQRSFLQDGDVVKITGWARGKDYCVGFGDVSGKIVAAA